MTEPIPLGTLDTVDKVDVSLQFGRKKYAPISIDAIIVIEMTETQATQAGMRIVLLNMIRWLVRILLLIQCQRSKYFQIGDNHTAFATDMQASYTLSAYRFSI